MLLQSVPIITTIYYYLYYYYVAQNLTILYAPYMAEGSIDLCTSIMFADHAKAEYIRCYDDKHNCI